MTECRHLLQASRPDGGEEDGGSQGQKSLVRADVAGSFVAADMLFARLEVEGKAVSAFAIGGLTDQSAGHLADVFVPTCEDAKQRATVLQRCSEGLAFGDGDINSIVGRFFQEAGANGVERQDGESTCFMGDRRQGCDVFETAKEVGMLNDDCRCFCVDCSSATRSMTAQLS